MVQTFDSCHVVLGCDIV